MIVRTAAGVIAGAVAGAGSLLTLDVVTRYCNGGFGRTGCGASFPLTFGLSFAIWMVVTAGLICAAFRMLRVERGWWHHLLESAYVTAACAGYAVAALCTGRRRTG